MTKNLVPNQGEIQFDDQKISDLTYQEVQQHITLVPQNAKLWTDTLYNNIDLRREYDQEELLKWLDKFNLLDRFNSTTWEEVISDEMNLSGGQKQRLILIRSLLEGKPFIILDESLSQLDHENYKEAERIITNQPGGVIHITHRIQESDRSLYDEVLEL